MMITRSIAEIMMPGMVLLCMLFGGGTNVKPQLKPFLENNPNNLGLLSPTTTTTTTTNSNNDSSISVILPVPTVNNNVTNQSSTTPTTTNITTSSSSSATTSPPVRAISKAWFEDHKKGKKKLSIIVWGARYKSGITSMILNHIAQKIYANDLGRSVAVDTVPYYTQYNANVGILGGWFRPTFPVIQNQNDQEVLACVFPAYEACGGSNSSAAKHKRHKMTQLAEMGDYVHAGELQEQLNKMEQERSKVPNLNRANALDANGDDLILLNNPSPEFRQGWFFKKYGQRGNQLFQRFATEACANLQFNEHALEQFAQLKANHQIPDFSRRRQQQAASVAFHIRRGDKLKGESKLYQGREYVEKLVAVMDEGSSPAAAAASTTIENCFVATDDYRAVAEIQEALQANNVGCTLHTLATESQRGHRTFGDNQFDEVVQFLTEMTMMIDATYFVGTFDSNVGALVTLLRSCVYPDAPHYHHSYGVDGDEWWFR